MKTKHIIRIALSLLTAGSMCLAALPAQAATDHPNLLIGDADRDGVIDIDDVTAIQRYLAEMITFDEQTAYMAKTDFTRDDLTIADATVIQKHLADYDTPEAREVGHAAYVYKKKQYTKAPSYYQSQLSTQMNNYSFSGVGFITRNGHVLAQYTRGENYTYDENYERQINPITMDTQFTIGPLSAQICATAVLMLQDQGKLSVTDKLEQYFPEYTIGKNLTLHQLLCMRSGIRDFFNCDQSLVYQDEPHHEWGNELTGDREQDIQIIKEWLFTQPLRYTSTNVSSFPLSYSNSNYLLLALIIEQVSGMPYHDFIKENIFTPLGMTRSCFVHECENVDDVAAYYSLIKWMPEHNCLMGACDIVSVAADMDKWLTALSDNALLSEESYRAMTTAYTQKNGYGIIIDNSEDLKGGLCYFGQLSDSSAGVYTLPSEHINVFLVTNDRRRLDESNQTADVVAGNLVKTIVKTEA